MRAACGILRRLGRARAPAAAARCARPAHGEDDGDGDEHEGEAGADYDEERGALGGELAADEGLRVLEASARPADRRRLRWGAVG